MVQHAKFSSKGQIVVPIELRKRLGFKPGTTVTMTEQNGALVIESHAALVRRLCGSMKGGPGPSLMKILLAERRKDKRKEDRLL